MGISKVSEEVIDEQRIAQFKKDCDDMFDLTRTALSSEHKARESRARYATKRRIRDVGYALTVDGAPRLSEETLDNMVGYVDILLMRLAILSNIVDRNDKHRINEIDILKTLCWKLVTCIDLNREGRTFRDRAHLDRYMVKN